MIPSARFRWTLTVLCVWVVLPVSSSEAATHDLAELVPPDALAYAAWSNLLEEDQQTLLRKVVEAVNVSAKGGNREFQICAGWADLVEAVVQGPGVVALLDLQFGERGPDVQLALVLKAGGRAEEIAGRLEAMLRPEGSPGTIQRTTLGGVEVRRAHILDASVEVIWGAHEQRFFAALGEAAAGKIIQQLSGPPVSLAENPELKFDRAKLKIRSGAAKLEVFVDLPAGIAGIKRLIEGRKGALPPMVDTAIDALGIGSIKSIYACVPESESLPPLSVFTHVDGPLEGLLSFWKQSPLSDEDLKVVSKDAYWAVAWNLDLHVLWKNTLQTVKKIHPESLPVVQGAVGMAAGVLGFSSFDEMWSLFGDTWVLYDAPNHGGIFATGAVLVAEVKNREALEGVLARAITTINTFGQGKVTVVRKETSHGTHTIHYVLIGGVPCPVAPAWGFAGDRWVFGLFPQSVAEAMKQVDATTRTSSILDHPHFRAGRKLSPAEVQGIVYADAQYFARQLYPLGMLLQTAGVSQLAPGGLSLDLKNFPPLPETLRDVHNVVYTESADDDGILCVYAGSGMPVLAVVSVPALAASALLPSLSRARESAKRVVCSANMSGIAVSVFIYANEENGRYPPDLQILVDRGDFKDFADKNFLCLSSGEPPGDIRACYIYVSGQSAESDPRNVLLYEKLRNHAGKGANVAFVDGHVEWMKPNALKQALLATYQRLGRENEMPAELRP